jgi:hypothetical protein
MQRNVEGKLPIKPIKSITEGIGAGGVQSHIE